MVFKIKKMTYFFPHDLLANPQNQGYILWLNSQFVTMELQLIADYCTGQVAVDHCS